jgi:hypothetical protein
MEFEIPVVYKGIDLSFPARIVNFGYLQKIEVNVEGELFLFEPDEERNYLPVLNSEQLDKKGKLNLELLKTITEVLRAAKESL